MSKFLILALSLTLVGCGTTPPSEEKPAPSPYEAEAPAENQIAEPSESEALSAGSYTDFAGQDLESLTSEKTIVFFYADWCSKCRKWEQMILENQDQLAEGVQIIKADYDRDKELVSALGVKQQSSAVFLEPGKEPRIEIDPSLEVINAFFTTY